MDQRTLTELRKLAESKPGSVRICRGCHCAFDERGSVFWTGADECPVCKHIGPRGEILCLKGIDEELEFTVLQSGNDIQEARDGLKNKIKFRYWQEEEDAIKRAKAGKK